MHPPRPTPALITGLIAGLLAVAATAHAQIPGLGDDTSRSAEQLVPVEVMADVETVHPGQQFHVAVHFQIERGWHIYWINPGAAGLATSVELKAPPGFEVGPARFTRPTAFPEPEGTTFGYEREAMLFVPVKAPAGLSGGEARFEVAATWLVCKGVCLLGSAERTIDLATSGTAVSAAEPGTADPQVIRHRERLPAPFAKLRGATLRFDGSTLTLVGPAAGHARAELFPVEVPGVTYGKAVTAVEGDRFRITVPVELNPQNALGKPMAIRGVVTLGRRLDDPCYEFDHPLTATGAPAAGTP